MTTAHPFLPMARLKQRRDFLRVAASGRKAALPGLVLQTRQRGAGNGRGPRVGFTVSKKVGNAVARNRARRRLRAAAAEVMPRLAAPGRDYVLIGRAATPKRPWSKLTDDLKTALGRLGAAQESGTGGAP